MKRSRLFKEAYKEEYNYSSLNGVKTMKYYSIYKCIKCKREEILINDDLKNIETRCAYCSSKKVIEEGQYDNLKECLKNKEY